MDGFIETISAMHNGRTVHDLDHQLAELVRAVQVSGRKGQLSLVLVVEPASKGTIDVLSVSDRISIKTPTAERGAAIFYPHDEGKLSRKDIRQQELPLRVVEMEKPAAEQLKEVQG